MGRAGPGGEGHSGGGGEADGAPVGRGRGGLLPADRDAAVRAAGRNLAAGGE